MKTQPLIPYGYKAYTGKALANAHVDTYNRLTEEINTWIAAGRDVPEHILNERHRHFALCATINKP